MRRWAWWGGLVVIGVGLLLSAYLLARTLDLMAATPPNGADWCSAVFGRGCDATLVDSRAARFGLPLAGWGIVFYGTLAFALLGGWLLGGVYQDRASLGAFLLALGGAAAGFLLTAGMFRGEAPFCPLCVVAHALTVLAVIFVGLAHGSPWRALRDAFRVDRRMTALLALTMLLTGVALFLWARGQTRERLLEASTFDSRAALAAYEREPVQEIPGKSRGVRMVVFTSFQCPACREFARATAYLRERFGKRLSLELRHFPLSSDCNPAAPDWRYRHACGAALAAEAARKQDKLQEFHDRLFATAAEPDAATLRAVATEAGIDLDRFDADAASDEVKEQVARDVKLAESLGVDGTPAVFIDGRRVRDLRPRNLEFLIAHLALAD